MGTSLFLFREVLLEHDVALELLYGRGELPTAFTEEGIKTKDRERGQLTSRSRRMIFSALCRHVHLSSTSAEARAPFSLASSRFS